MFLSVHHEPMAIAKRRPAGRARRRRGLLFSNSAFGRPQWTSSYCPLPPYWQGWNRPRAKKGGEFQNQNSIFTSLPHNWPSYPGSAASGLEIGLVDGVTPDQIIVPFGQGHQLVPLGGGQNEMAGHAGSCDDGTANVQASAVTTGLVGDIRALIGEARAGRAAAVNSALSKNS
jgi:hypothetical protein